MPFRLFGGLALALSGIFAGFACAKREKSVFLQTQALCTALRDMSARVRMENAPLPELVRELSERSGAADGIFVKAAQCLREGAGFSQAMESACALIGDERARGIARSLFARAGSLGSEETLARFAAACAELEERMAELRAQYEKRAPLMRRLGAAAGICAAILLI